MSQKERTSYCIGRFQFQVGLPLVLAGRRQSIYQIAVSTLPLSPDAPAAEVWRQRLASIRKGVQPAVAAAPVARSGVDPVIRTFDLDPGVWAVLYYGDLRDKSNVTLEIMKPFEGHALRLVREMTAARADAGAATGPLYRAVVAGYVPDSRRGFCIEHGALESEVSEYEETEIGFVHPQLAGLGLSFGSDSVYAPDPRDPIDFVEEERKLLMASGGLEVVILLNERRTVAQLQGVEQRIRLAAGTGKPLVRFTWRFPGTSRKASEPEIMLKGTASAEDQAELEAVWEPFLRSIQQVPLASKEPVGR
jgi:hypothetical protein